MLKNRPAPQLLLFSSLILLISTLASTSPHNATHSPGVPKPRLFGPAEDYSNLDDETTVMAPTHRGSPAPRCNYDRCKDQESCQKLALALSCTCPGITSPYVPPDPPVVQSLLLQINGMVVLRWCEPPSPVTHYLIKVEGEDGAHKAEENRRMMELVDIAPGTEVCVEAANKAGFSSRGSHSCARFEAGSSESGSSETRLAIKLTFIGAAVVLVVAVMLGLLLWCCKRHRKSSTRTVNRGTDVVL